MGAITLQITDSLSDNATFELRIREIKGISHVVINRRTLQARETGNIKALR